MPLPINDNTLDLETRGLPTVITSSTVIDANTLDYDERGMPFWMVSIVPPSVTLTTTACIVVLTAPETGVRTIERRYPNKRVEMVGETQTKHVQPMFAVQDPVYIP